MSKQNFEPTYLCKCNNCGTVMLDNNPQVGSPLFIAKVWYIADMEYIKPKEDEEGFCGCGKCQTDGYLTDDISKEDEDKLRSFGYIQ